MDYEDLENIAVWCFDFWDPNENYVAASSFVQFLVNQYGEETVIASLYGNKDPLPATYAELIRAWKEHIESRYQEYSKYEKKTSGNTLKNDPVTWKLTACTDYLSDLYKQFFYALQIENALL